MFEVQRNQVVLRQVHRSVGEIDGKAPQLECEKRMGRVVLYRLPGILRCQAFYEAEVSSAGQHRYGVRDQRTEVSGRPESRGVCQTPIADLRKLKHYPITVSSSE